MIGVLTHHWAKDDKIDEARRLLEGNGRAQSQAPGFGARTTLYSLTDPTKDYQPRHMGQQRDLRPVARQPGASRRHDRRRRSMVPPAGVGALPTRRLTSPIPIGASLVGPRPLKPSPIPAGASLVGAPPIPFFPFPLEGGRLGWG